MCDGLRCGAQAYALAGKSYFATEAVEQIIALCTAKEHLHKTVVILAGYTKKIDKMLREANPGLASR